MGGPGPNVASTAQMPVAQSAPAAASVPRPVRPAPTPRIDPNAPLSIIPGQAEAAPPAPAPVAYPYRDGGADADCPRCRR